MTLSKWTFCGGRFMDLPFYHSGEVFVSHKIYVWGLDVVGEGVEVRNRRCVSELLGSPVCR